MFRYWMIICLCLLTTIQAQAHPGHDGDHDTDGFVWTADHLARHPLATLLIATAVGLTAWSAARLASSLQRQVKAAAIRTPTADKSA